MKSTLLISLSLVVLGACSQPPIEEYTVIPQPVEMSYSPGVIRLGNEPTISFPAELTNEAEMMQAYLSEDHQVKASLRAGKEKGDIQLKLDASVLPDQKEGYILDATKGDVVIASSTAQGVFHGMQTLRQAIKEKDGKLTVQKSMITDYPAFAWRAFMLDESRFFQGKEAVIQMIDAMAELKFNTFHWHLTNDQGWRIEIKKYPKLTEIGAWRDSSQMLVQGKHIYDRYEPKRHGGFYTQEQLKEIVKYAEKRHVTMMPEISMPGHASAAIAAYPWLGTENKQIKVPVDFGVHYNVYNVASPKVKEFLSDVMDEVIAIFPSAVIHVGGDEVKYDQWKKSPEIRAYMQKHGLKTPAEVQINFTNEVCEMLAAKGKHMMGWNEITGDKINEYQSDQDTKATTKKLAPGTIVHFWKGDPALIKKTIEKGYDVVNSYYKFTYLDYAYTKIPLEKAYSFNPVPEGLTPEQAAKVMGMGCQMWGEYIPTIKDMNYKVYPRIAAYSEDGWTNAENKDYNRFLKGLKFFLNKWEKQGIEYGPIETPAQPEAKK